MLTLPQKIGQQLGETYEERVTERRQLVHSGYLNKRHELRKIMTNLNGNEGQKTVSEDENIQNVLGDIPDDFSGFVGKEKNADEKMANLREGLWKEEGWWQ